MRILILGINYRPEKIGIAVYTGDLAQALAQSGHAVHVVTAKPYYPEWRVAEGSRRRGWWREHRDGVDILRCPIYVPSNPTGARRLLHHGSFACSAMLPMLWNAIVRRPDAVLCIAPSLLAAPLGWMAARLARGTAWLHVQDFEVDAAAATGLLDGQSRFFRWAKAAERVIMRRFDRVSSIGPEMCRRLRELGVDADKVRQVRNWADLQSVVPQPASSFRRKWDIRTPHVALYSGNIANKQGIEIVITAAKRLRHRDDLTFVICGEGPNRAALERMAACEGNIVMAGLQPKEQLSDLLSLATVHLLPQKAGAADLVLPSKLTNMLASGRPVVATAAADTGLAREVEGCGIVTPPEDVEAFGDAIETLLEQPELCERYGRAARARAESDWDKNRIVKTFMDELEAAHAVRKASVR
jgi:colanic acid biosynthesis glycosyl transferase WcaI